MRLALDETQQALRQEVAELLTEHPPPDTEALDFPGEISALRAWQKQLADASLLGLAWPRELGGRAASALDQVVVNRALARAAAPRLPGFVGLDVVGPSLVEHGTPAQRERYIPPILSADEIWCQGFSEPGAGSDLAALKARAEVHADHFVLNGQKTWTTLAQFARWCAVLARTNPNASGHKAISYLLVDLESPGITIRPMRLISGEEEFSEVFFDDVIVPRANLLGPLHGGWSIAMHTLGHERGYAAAARQATLRTMLDELIEVACTGDRDGRPALESPAVADLLARAEVMVEVLGSQTMSSLGRDEARGGPGFESSVDKLFLTATEQQIGQLTLAVLGPRAVSTDSRRDEAMRNEYLYGRAASVYGGSAQIQRTIIAQRLLGLPRGT
jgi:alkylation response protein AidB-like acyl-CoA dehydrogenase